MRKLLLGLIIAAVAVVLFISIRPLLGAINFDREPEPPEDPEAQIELSPAGYFTVSQGENFQQALLVTNNMSETINFSVGHEHSHLTFNPRGERLAPGRTREIELQVDHLCPPGDIELPVYLRAEVNDKRVGKDTALNFAVIPGWLSMEQEDNELRVLWNDEPAPSGVLVTYRPPGEDDWRVWGETPRLDPPDHLEGGSHEFEFQARLGEVESPVEVFSIEIEVVVVEEEEVPEEEAPREEAPPARTAAAEEDDDDDDYGTMDWAGGTYSGPLKDGRPHGRGEWTHPDGRIYRGQFVNGNIQGQGVMTFPGGIEYRGQFADGVAHGSGTMTHPTEGSISGDWHRGRLVEQSDEEEDVNRKWFEN